jgi:hypothetical protein
MKLQTYARAVAMPDLSSEIEPSLRWLRELPRHFDRLASQGLTMSGKGFYYHQEPEQSRSAIGHVLLHAGRMSKKAV